MFICVEKSGNMYGILDTRDNTEERVDKDFLLKAKELGITFLNLDISNNDIIIHHNFNDSFVAREMNNVYTDGYKCFDIGREYLVVDVKRDELFGYIKKIKPKVNCDYVFLSGIWCYRIKGNKVCHIDVECLDKHYYGEDREEDFHCGYIITNGKVVFTTPWDDRDGDYIETDKQGFTFMGKRINWEV